MGKPIEEEIQQHKFRNLQQKLAVNLIYTTNWLNSKYIFEFKKYGITPQQFNVLRILRGQLPNPCKLILIRSRMLDKTSDVSRIVERLRKSELIERVMSTNDRRAVDIKISEKGLSILSKLDLNENVFDEIYENLSDSEIKQLNNLLDKLRH